MDWILDLQAKGFWLNTMLPLATAAFLAVSVWIQRRHLQAYECEQRERAAKAQEEARRTQEVFQAQVRWSAIAALIQAETFVHKSQSSAPDRFHKLHAALLKFVELDLSDDLLR